MDQITEVRTKLTRIESLHIMNSVSEMFIGNTIVLQYDLLPADPTYQEVRWKSSNQDVATIDSDGKLTAGTVDISLFSEKENISEIIKIQIVEPTIEGHEVLNYTITESNLFILPENFSVWISNDSQKEVVLCQTTLVENKVK